MHNQVKILRVLQLISLLKKPPAKSIKNLSSILNNTDRTVYRYLDLIKELGFDLHKDQLNRFQIVGDFESDNNTFTPEEALLLKDMLLTSGSKNLLKDSILKKIYLQSEVAIQGNNLLNAHLGKIIETLSSAILNERQVVLRNYHSVSSSKIEDRIVEPIKFTDNYTFICAFEPSTNENKYFKIERITEVKLTDKSYNHKDQHHFSLPDAFGFAPTNEYEPFDVELRLKLTAYILLKEEYPAVGPYIKTEPNSDLYILKIRVNNPKPVLRFIMGLLDEVEVIGSFEFQEYLLGHIGRLFIMKPDEYSPGDDFE